MPRATLEKALNTIGYALMLLLDGKLHPDLHPSDEARSKCKNRGLDVSGSMQPFIVQKGR